MGTSAGVAKKAEVAKKKKDEHQTGGVLTQSEGKALHDAIFDYWQVDSRGMEKGSIDDSSSFRDYVLISVTKKEENVYDFVASFVGAHIMGRKKIFTTAVTGIAKQTSLSSQKYR